MPRVKDIDEEIISHWSAMTKSEQPGDKIIKRLLCTNNAIHTGGYGKPTRSVVFTDVTVPGLNYIWITTAGEEFAEGEFYNITAKCDARGILKRVKIIPEAKSEQPDEKIKSNPVDVFNLIYGTD